MASLKVPSLSLLPMPMTREALLAWHLAHHGGWQLTMQGAHREIFQKPTKETM